MSTNTYSLLRDAIRHYISYYGKKGISVDIELPPTLRQLKSSGYTEAQISGITEELKESYEHVKSHVLKVDTETGEIKNYYPAEKDVKISNLYDILDRLDDVINKMVDISHKELSRSGYDSITETGLYLREILDRDIDTYGAEDVVNYMSNHVGELAELEDALNGYDSDGSSVRVAGSSLLVVLRSMSPLESALYTGSMDDENWYEGEEI